MTVRLKLVLIVLFLALVPVSVLAWNLLRIHQAALERNLTSLHQAAAAEEGQRVAFRLNALRDTLERLTTHTMPWSEFSVAERQSALWLVYRTDPDIVAVMLLDGQRRMLEQPVYVTQSTAAEEPLHMPQSSAIVAPLVAHLSSRPEDAASSSFGRPFVVGGDSTPILPMSLPVRLSTAGDSAAVLAIGISVRRVCAPRPPSDLITLRVVDEARRLVCSAEGARALAPLGAALVRAIDSGARLHRYRDASNQEMLISVASVPFGWQVIAEQPVAHAFAASRRMLVQSIVWISVSIIIALASGLLLARGISEPVERLTTGVKELTRGNLDFRLEMKEADEFGRLGRAFDAMAAEILEQDARIRQWNSQLQEKVEERTRAIEQYHSHLVQAEKASVMARLCVGIATEINDPLTGILGAVQLLSVQARTDPTRVQDARLCANAEEGAQRIRELIRRVQLLGQRQPKSQLRPLAIEDLLGSVIRLLSHHTTTEGVEVTMLSDGGLPFVVGNFTQLEHAILQLLINAVCACNAAMRAELEMEPTVRDSGYQDPSRRRRILVQLSCAESRQVKIAVSDEGVGIPMHELERIFEPFVTLRSDSGSGLGLTVARRIVEEHGGRLWAESLGTVGATFNLLLPSAEDQAVVTAGSTVHG